MNKKKYTKIYIECVHSREVIDFCLQTVDSIEFSMNVLQHGNDSHLFHYKTWSLYFEDLL